MASVKIVLRKKKNKDGTYPLAIRITKDRKSSYIHVGHHIDENFWDKKNRKVKKSHPNSVRLNNLLSKKLGEAEDGLLDLEIQKNDATSHTIKRKIKAPKGTSFFSLAETHLAGLKKQGKRNSYKSDKTRIEAFKAFLGNRDIAFQDITVQLLTKYKVYLKGERKIGQHTIFNYLTMIQTIFNQALKASIVEHKYYPFGKDKISLKAPRSLKIGLSPEEVKQVVDMELVPESEQDHARNIWLLAFYFAGMRVSDVLRLKWVDFQNDRLYYTMGKNAKPDSLKVPEKAEKILALYRGKEYEHGLVFPYLQNVEDFTNLYEVQEQIAIAVGKLDRALKDIATKVGLTKKLTMHIARHTFGNISGEKIPIQMLQKLYRHSSITTTIGYQANFMHKTADDALDAVIDF